MKMKMGLMLLILAGCQTTHPDSNTSTARKSGVTFEEFMKVVTPRSELFPLSGGKESLLLVALPSDEYVKLYRLDHQTQQFKLEFDAGRAISGLVRDDKLKHVYLLVDNDGDENTGIYGYDLKTHELTEIFVKEGFESSIVDFGNQGETLYIRSNFEKKDVYSIYQFDLKDLKPRRLTDGKQSWDGALVSPDGKLLALQQAKGNSESTVTILNLKSKKSMTLLGKADTNYDLSFFYPQTGELYINANEGRDRFGCAKISPSGKGQLTWIKVEDQKDLKCFRDLSGGVTYLYESHDGQRRVKLFEGIFDKEIPLALPDHTNVFDISTLPGEESIFFRMSKSDAPSEFYRIGRKPENGVQPQKISHLNQSSLAEKDFGQSSDIRYKSFDGMEIHGILYAKDLWSKDLHQHPVIIWPHGGPDSYESHTFNPIFQFWIQQGFVVFAPNFRGSTGYGKKFETLNDHDWGGGHIKDVIWGKREVEKLPYVDPKRMFIVGASFGGYSTLSAITSFPNEFKGAVAIMAIANLFTFLNSIPPDPAWQLEFHKEVGDPVEDSEFLKERSPFFHAEAIRTPLKIYQAENDVRTVQGEMDSYVEKLRELGIKVDYEILTNEGHGITRKETWQKVLQGTTDFLNGL